MKPNSTRTPSRRLTRAELLREIDRAQHQLLDRIVALELYVFETRRSIALQNIEFELFKWRYNFNRESSHDRWISRSHPLHDKPKKNRRSNQ